MYVAMLSRLSGLKFWKCGSRKIYAIQRAGKQKLSHKVFLTSESDSESDFEPAKKKHRSESPSLTRVAADIRDIRNDLQSLFDISKNVKLPLALHRQLQDTFKCNICRSSPMKPPVIFSRCCKRLLGCQECVDRWFGGNDGSMKSCPLCRSERAYADTCIVKGLDEFLKSIAPLVSGSSSIELERDDV